MKETNDVIDFWEERKELTDAIERLRVRAIRSISSTNLEYSNAVFNYRSKLKTAASTIVEISILTVKLEELDERWITRCNEQPHGGAKERNGRNQTDGH